VKHLPELTRREHEVRVRVVLSKRQCATLQMLGRGMLPVGIAREFQCDPETIKTHVRRAMEKLGAATRTEAVLLHAAIHRRSCPPQGDDPVTA